MFHRALTVILLASVLAGCGSTSRIFQRGPTVPVVEKVVVEKFVRLPEEHLKRGKVAKAKDRSVGEYVRVANTNTPLLEQCYFQLGEIEKLQPKEKP